MSGSEKLDEMEVLQIELEVMRRQHRDLDEAIAALEERGPLADVLMIRRLKKQKLSLKDRMSRIEDRLTPDIIA
ncbi:YdcH family protein [Pseudoroseicyclus sp. H15]